MATPVKSDPVSKREFDCQIRSWRRFLHTYDSEEAKAAAAQAKVEAQALAQAPVEGSGSSGTPGKDTVKSGKKKSTGRKSAGKKKQTGKKSAGKKQHAGHKRRVVRNPPALDDRTFPKL